MNFCSQFLSHTIIGWCQYWEAVLEWASRVRYHLKQKPPCHFLLLLVPSPPRQATRGHNFLTKLGQKEADILVLYYTCTSIHIFIKRRVLKNLSLLFYSHNICYWKHISAMAITTATSIASCWGFISFFYIQWRHITNHYELIGYQNTGLHTKTETNWGSYD